MNGFVFFLFVQPFSLCALGRSFAHRTAFPLGLLPQFICRHHHGWLTPSRTVSLSLLIPFIPASPGSSGTLIYPISLYCTWPAGFFPAVAPLVAVLDCSWREADAPGWPLLGLALLPSWDHPVAGRSGLESALSKVTPGFSLVPVSSRRV